MEPVDNIFQEFIDALQTAKSADAFERIAVRITTRLGFERFAYLRLGAGTPMLISSYPKSWTNRYFRLGYQQLDPVVRRARAESAVFSWGGGAATPEGTRDQRRFFDEAMTFGIRAGITVPIRAGFGDTAAFTLATSDREPYAKRLVADRKDVVQLVGLYFHTHLTARLDLGPTGPTSSCELTQRERQCLTWAAQGKTVADIAVLVAIAPRTVVFHLENARRKLNAASIAQCVAEALRRGLLS